MLSYLDVNNRWFGVMAAITDGSRSNSAPNMHWYPLRAWAMRYVIGIVMVVVGDWIIVGNVVSPMMLFFSVFPATFMFILREVKGMLLNVWNNVVDIRLWVEPVSINALIFVLHIVIVKDLR